MAQYIFIKQQKGRGHDPPSACQSKQKAAASTPPQPDTEQDRIHRKTGTQINASENRIRTVTVFR